MRIGIVGCGSVGARAARQLLASPQVDQLVVCDIRADRASTLAHSLGDGAVVAGDVRDADVDGVLLACDTRAQFVLARDSVAAGRFVVSTSDSLDDVRLMRTLDAAATRSGAVVVVGAGFAPGLTCILARLAAGWFDSVDEIHIAKVGTGGPACAREHHRAFRAFAVDWREGAWAQRRGGSGRELCWFPDPIGGRDCYRAALADSVLLVDAFPEVRRVTARVAATRRDRLTMHLPMLRPPHIEGGIGAVRVEVRGRVGLGTRVVVLGAIDRPAVAAGAVAAQTSLWIGDGRLSRPGTTGLAEIADAKGFLRELAVRGVKAAVFDGTPSQYPRPEPLGANESS
jgi:hypothetical protein